MCSCASQFFPPYMLSSNLHLATHLRLQESQHGPLALCAEWWIERALQLIKSAAGRRLSRNVERLMVNTILLGWKVSELAGTGLAATLDELVPGYRSLPLTGPAYDDGDASGAQALHKGKLLSGLGRTQQSLTAAAKARNEALERVEAFVRRYSGRYSAFAAPDSVQRARLYVHSQVSRGARDILTSRFHSASSRCSAHVAIRFEEDDREHVGQVQHFLRVVPAQQDDPEWEHGPLRLAVIRLYKYREPDGVVLMADQWENKSEDKIHVVDVSSIAAPLVTTTEVDGAGTRGNRRPLLRFVKYSNCSRA